MSGTMYRSTEYRLVGEKIVPICILTQLIVELGAEHKMNNHTNESIITNWFAFLERK